MLPLDADSLMSGEQIVRLVRMMQAHPKIGILQSLVVGMPSSSAFARIFQFGMRHGMRSYTMGQAWWVGDCGPFWGHNALVRIKPFHEQCDLPMLPGKPPLGGHVLSHDQVEATLMRRAGYEVRVLPEERGSWEENPPTMLEFARRDVRWCQGNMQYLKLLDLPGLYPMSRFQLVWAILMFIGIPAWTLMIALLPVAAWEAQAIADFPIASRHGLYITFFTMYLMPKIAGLLDAVLTGRRAALRRLAALLRQRGDRARVLVPAGRRVDHPHVDLHGRPLVRPIDHLERSAPRCTRHHLDGSGAGTVAATGVRCCRDDPVGVPVTGGAGLELAVDGRLCSRHSVCSGDCFARARSLHAPHRTCRHSGGLCAAP